jgi:DNA polymerase II small subunit/DNA polymerase delta subunit B
MKAPTEHEAMSQGRGLLTEREREAIAGETSDSYRYKTRSFFRDRLEALEDDVDVLEEHDPELLEELRDVVCREEED